MLFSSYRNGAPPPRAQPSARLGYALGAVPATLKRGSRSDLVKTLQAHLNNLGFDTGTPDGIFGPKTAAAVKAFQKSKGLKADGIVGPKTWGALGIGAGGDSPGPAPSPAPERAPTPAPPPPPPTKPPPRAKSAAATTLQRAVTSLGARANDPALRIKVDGIIGPKTATAVNRALTRYADAAPANLRTGKLSVAQIKDNWNPITIALEQAAREAAPTSPTPPAPEPTRADVRRLQTGLRKLGTLTNDTMLKIAVDGVVGPRTAAAASKITGQKLTIKQVKSELPKIVMSVEAAVAKYENATPGPPTPPEPTPVDSTPRLAVARLQRALASLGELLGDRTLAIKSDGIAGPKTAAALNHALQNYVRDKPASMTQRLLPAQIAVMAGQLTTQIESELARRRAEAARPSQPVPTPAPQPSPAPAPAPQYTPQPEYPPRYAEETSPAPIPAPEEKKKLHWGWFVGGGTALLIVGGLTVAAFSKRGDRRRLVPA